MSPLHLLLWAGGVGLVAFGVLRIRGPVARRQELRETRANLARYDDWRGSRIRTEPGERTGADEMDDLLRRRIVLWGAVIALGIVLVTAGFLVR